MRITKLTAQNFKGWSGSMDLAPVTLIRGRNSRGKSARLQALWLALSGAMPGEGKDNQAMNSARAIYDAFASGNPMIVGASTDDKEHVTMVYSMMNGSVSGPKEGWFKGIATLDLNAVELLSRPGPERTRLLLERSGSGGDAQAVKDKLCAKLKVTQIFDNQTEQHTAEFERLVIEYCDSIQQCDEDDVLKAFEAIEAMLAEQKKLADQNVKRLEQTGQGLAQMAEGEAPPQDAEQRLAKARHEHEAAVQARATAQAAHEAAKRELQAAERAGGPLAVTNAPITTADLRPFEEDLRVIEAHPAPDPGPQKPVMDRLRIVESNLRTAEVAIANSKARLESLGNSSLIADYDHDIKKLEASKCPECGHPLKKNVKRIAEFKALRKQVAKEAKANMAEATEQVAQCATYREATLEALRAANAELDKWNTAALAYHRWSESRHAAKDRLQAARDAVAAAGEAQRKATEARAKLPALKAWMAEKAAELAARTSHVMLAQEEVYQCDIAFRRLLAHRAEQSSKAKAAQALKSARAEAAVAKAALDACRELQASTLEQAIKPVIEACNRLCEPILPGPAYFADGEFGMEVGGRKVGYNQASDSEKLMLCAALGVALASKAPLRLFTLGRFESFDYEKKPKLVGLLCDLCERGELDQAVMVEVAGTDIVQLGIYNRTLNGQLRIVEVE